MQHEQAQVYCADTSAGMVLARASATTATSSQHDERVRDESITKERESEGSLDDRRHQTARPMP